MPFYKVDTKGEEKPRLIKAASQADALKHVTADKFSFTLVQTVDEAAPIFEAGVKLERTENAPA